VSRSGVVVVGRQVLGRGHQVEGIIGDGVGRGLVVMDCSLVNVMVALAKLLVMRLPMFSICIV
jgi:hypothetical protein